MTPIVPRKIALEEHFAIEETLMDSAGFVPQDHWLELKSRLLDVQDKRLRLMDRHGVEMMVLSLNAPAIQAMIDPYRANELARRANDTLAAEVAKRPDRFRAFAALPMQEPDLATRELERCVTELDFKGALVNGFSQAGDPNIVLYYCNIGRSGKPSSAWTFHSTCTHATRCRPTRRSMMDTPGYSDRHGRSVRKRPCTRFGSSAQGCSMSIQA